MIFGFGFNLWGLFFDRKLLGYFWLRLIHFAGIIFVFSLELLGKYCPLTLLENYLYRIGEFRSAYRGSFIVHYLEKIVYPDVMLFQA